MKKIVKIGLILIIAICVTQSVYAAFSCNVMMQANKTKVNKEEDFTVDFNIANIQSKRGVISLGATLEYDKDSLELTKMEGKNGWETPAEGASYNASNGKIVVTRNSLGKNNETVFTLTFKAKKTSKQNPTIVLRNIAVADGTTPAKINLVSQKITVADNTQNPNPEPGKDENQNTNMNTNTNQNTGSNTNGKQDSNVNLKKNTNTKNETNTSPNNNGQTEVDTNQEDNTEINEDTNMVTDSELQENETETENSIDTNPLDDGALPETGNGTIIIFIVLILLIVLIIVIFLVNKKKKRRKSKRMKR